MSDNKQNPEKTAEQGDQVDANVSRIMKEQWRDCADCKHVPNFAIRPECEKCSDDPARPYWELADNWEI